MPGKVRISDGPATLAGYDIVLAISEEAVNAQLQKLYETRITRGPLPPPGKPKKFASAPQATHLINHDFVLHEMVLHKKKQTWEEAKHGIDGHILCPRIRFRPRKDADAKMQFRSAFVEITFMRDESASEGKQDSILKYWDVQSSPPELTDVVINDYTMSWQVDVMQEHIKNVMEDLIDPSDSKDSVITIPDKAAEQIKALNPRIFTVSSIFCAFQESKIVDSFQLTGPDGATLGLEHMPEIKAFTNGVSKYFQALQDATPTSGASTVDNPFVLGYAISQKIPDIHDFDPTVSSKDTPVFFQPKQYNLSITPGKLGSGLKATSGTLNYCMLTHRKEGSTEPIKVDPSDLNAGGFKDTFFDITKTFGRTQDSSNQTKGCDGIMAFSKGIFSNMWLASVAVAMLPDPEKAYRKVLAEATNEDEGNIRLKVDRHTMEATGTGWKANQKWYMTEIYKEAELLKPYARRKRCDGWCSVTIKYTSDTSKIQSLDSGIDASRKIHLDVECRNSISFASDTKGIHNLVQNEFSATQWLNAKTMDCRLNSLVKVDIAPASAGTWAVTIDKANSQNLYDKSAEIPAFGDMNDGNKDSWGNWQRFELHHMDKWFSKAESDARFSGAIKRWGEPTGEIMRNGLATAFSDMGTRIIMPAGEVFTFAGLDTDEQGNLYAQVSYANAAESGVSVVKAKK